MVTLVLSPAVALAAWAAPAGSPCVVVTFRSQPPMMYAESAARRLSTEVNGVGRFGDAFYGVTPTGAAVRITADGSMTTVGTAPGDAYTGTVHDGVWYLLSGRRILAYGLPAVTARPIVRLRSSITIGDWEWSDRYAALVALSTGGPSASLVAVTPSDGRVRTLARVRGLPPGGIYGGVWIDGDVLYAIHSGGSTYAVDLAAPTTARRVATGPAMASVDVAGCPAAPQTSPSPSSSASPSVSPSPSLSSSPSPSASPSRVVTPSPSRSPGPSKSSGPSPSTGHPVSPSPPVSPAAGRPAASRSPVPARIVRPAPHANPPVPAPIVAPPVITLPPAIAPAPPRNQVAPWNPVAVHHEQRAEQRERSRKRVAIAAAALTMAGVLARVGRTRVR
ncbi:DUF6923 family protein [Hamadaea tsunoensis]|uniref:DUF6923 family protein n=1 Tax=Hamadaea tsunoensis TaxID=53368 RepID=UPI000487DEB4|nr:hypothetical protein [Hamadaea tsunoensis]